MTQVVAAIKIKQKVFKRALLLMGNQFELSVVSDSQAWADERIDRAIEEIRRIESLLITFKDDK